MPETTRQVPLRAHEMEEDDSYSGAWESLAPPLRYLFLEQIVPYFLTCQDLGRLSAVSRGYNQLFGPPTDTGGKLLAGLLYRDAGRAIVDKNKDNCPYTYRMREQLPTIGTLTPEQSIQHNVILVAQLRKAALRRRSLILLDIVPKRNCTGNTQAAKSTADSESNRDALGEQLKQICAPYKSRPLADLVRIFRKDSNTVSPRILQETTTTFICINHSGVDLYCHWIDFSGQILVRDGDCLSPSLDSQQERRQRPASISLARPRGHTAPPHVFHHRSYIYHSFALCFREGGQPFAIYQQKRTWSWNLRAIRGGLGSPLERKSHAHAIAVWPGGQVEELHCNVSITPSHYYFLPVSRNTGLPVSDEFEEDNDAVAAEEGNAPCTFANENARSFYGINVPQYRQGMGWSRLPGTPTDPLNCPSVVSEAIWRHDNHRSL